MQRRTFLQLASASAAGLVIPDATSAAPMLPPAADAWSPRKIILGSDHLPPGNFIQNFTSTAEPLGGGRWRLWYSVSGSDPFHVGVAEGLPGEPLKLHPAALSSGDPADAPLAIGNLPEGWRPVQAVHLQLQNGRHRLYFWAHAEDVVRYLAADSEDGRRFRVTDPLRPCIYHPKDRAVSGEAAAEAGLKGRAGRKAALAPGEPLAAASLITNDATNVYQLPDGSFEMYTVALEEVAKTDPRYMAHDNIPGRIRVVDRLQSDDGLTWKNRQRVIVRDSNDAVDQQFYYLSVTHTPQGRIGLLGHYRLQTQTIDMEWCFSTDGISWQRPTRGPLFPRSPAGALPDSYGVYAPNAMVEHGGLWHLFYTGTNDAHNHKDSHGPRTRAIMHMTVPSPWA